MGSSGKYEFDQEQVKKPRSYTKWLVALGVVCVVLLVVSALAIGFGVGFSVSTEVTTVGLKDVSITDDELQGEYHTANGGIYFQTMLNATHAYFVIETTNGDVVVMFVHPLDTSMTMMVVNNTDFLMMKGEDGAEKEYLIPEEYRDFMGSVMMGHTEMTDEMLQQFDNKTVATVRESTLQNFAVSPEALLLIDAAKALGSRGIMGNDSRAVLRFYRFALRISNNRDMVLGIDDTSSDYAPSPADGKALVSRRKRFFGLDFCQNGGPVCSNNKCPGHNCFGMCGKQCSCWWFLCGDCCVHQYCRSHDQCCQDRGFWSWACLRVAYEYWWASCTDTYDC